MARKITYLGAAALTAVGLMAGLVLIASGSGAGPSRAPLRIDAFAEQYAWSFGFPESGNAYSAGDLHVPLGREVEFRLYSQDVRHAFWVPEWNLNEFSSPGVIGTATVTPDRAGTFALICAESCGLFHRRMRTDVVVEAPDRFRRWVDGLKREVPAPLAESVRLYRELAANREETPAAER